jgi:FkbH-like protein
LIGVASHELLARAHQLFTKTSQFNVTGRRFSPAELEAAVADAATCLLMVHARDRFGDMGWIGAVLLRSDGLARCHVDNFVLSCRALGRDIESVVLQHVYQLVFDQGEFALLTAEYRPGGRNAQVSKLFETQGFELTTSDADGLKRYALSADKRRHAECDWIAVKTEGNAWRKDSR